jgi:hypothetical protein
VTAAKWDLELWADVTCGEDGRAKVNAVHGAPRLTSRIAQAEVQKYLDAQRATFMTKSDDRGQRQPAPARLTVSLEGRYISPYIWLARGVMVLFTLGFGMIVFALWRGRRDAAAAAAH